ncbi:hypothetical protein [Thalassobellus suaedae]|uniref:hypothetical protein n=1 Tax=Thalassobellus suaedae TaxID=3074124 RepID=UPI0039F4C633
MPPIHEYFLFTLQKLYFSLNLFDFSLKLKGFPIDDAERFLKTIQNKKESDFTTYIEAKKKKLLPIT